MVFIARGYDLIQLFAPEGQIFFARRSLGQVEPRGAGMESGSREGVGAPELLIPRDLGLKHSRSEEDSSSTLLYP